MDEKHVCSTSACQKLAIARVNLPHGKTQYLCQKDLCAMKDFYMQELWDGEVEPCDYPEVEYFDKRLQAESKAKRDPFFSKTNWERWIKRKKCGGMR